MNITIDFFSSNIIEAIDAGVYKITVEYDNRSKPLYIGESVFVLVRCAMHLFQLKKNPNYFGFTNDNINNENITLKFEIIEKIENLSKRKHCEIELIKSTIESEGIICQSGIRDRMKSINDKIESLEDFLS